MGFNTMCPIRTIFKLVGKLRCQREKSSRFWRTIYARRMDWSWRLDDAWTTRQHTRHPKVCLYINLYMRRLITCRLSKSIRQCAQWRILKIQWYGKVEQMLNGLNESYLFHLIRHLKVQPSTKKGWRSSLTKRLRSATLWLGIQWFYSTLDCACMRENTSPTALVHSWSFKSSLMVRLCWRIRRV